MAKKRRPKSPAAKGRRPTSSTKSTSGDVPVYSDGQLVFRVDGGKSDGEKVSLDLVTASVKCGELELKHRLDDNEMKPTNPFLVDLAKAFGELGGFKCTATVAWQIWHEVSDRMAELQKKTS